MNKTLYTITPLPAWTHERDGSFKSGKYEVFFSKHRNEWRFRLPDGFDFWCRNPADGKEKCNEHHVKEVAKLLTPVRFPEVEVTVRGDEPTPITDAEAAKGTFLSSGPAKCVATHLEQRLHATTEALRLRMMATSENRPPI